MKKRNAPIILALIGFFAYLPCTGQGQRAADFPTPTPAQLAWQRAELGVVFHYDLHVFDGKKYVQSQNRINPILDVNIFDPEQLDTDQWVRAAKAAGAKFAIITATHETGFAIYQSDINPYSMRMLDFQDGKGDLVRDFVRSCRKYDIEPGIYVGIRWNSFLGVHNFAVEGESEFARNRQEAYKRMCEGMVEELCTRYGDLFLIWFDGGAGDPATTGPDVLPIVKKHQPDALFYHNAQRADYRWGGSESGTVPYPCWSTFPFPFSHSINQEIIQANNFALLKHGDPDGPYWMPAMSDAPLRGHNGRHEWFWEPGDEAHIEPVADLVDMYFRSVGHNSTLILGLTPDDRGLLPQPDVDTLAAFGEAIRRQFAEPLASTSGTGNNIQLELEAPQTVDLLVLQEDISQGERVRAYAVEALIGDEWIEVATGSCIGHKRLQTIEPVRAQAFRLRIPSSTAEPLIHSFAAFASQ